MLRCTLLAAASSVLLVCGCYPRFGFGCIAEGEPIATPGGSCPIESIRPGDPVLTAAGAGMVESVSCARSRELIVITTTSGRTLRTTPEHPIATDSGWLPADGLKSGSKVLTLDGGEAVARITRLSAPGRVYDLRVLPGEMFYASGVLVHNKTVAVPPTPDDFVGTWVHWSDVGVFYRMILRPDGTGQLAYGSLKSGESVGTLTWAPPKGRNSYDAAAESSFTEFPFQGQRDRLVMSGSRGMVTMRVALSVGDAAEPLKLAFIREDHLLRRLDEMRRKMESHGSIEVQPSDANP